MKTILKISAIFASAALIATGCIKETFPTYEVTSEQISASSEALSAMVGAMPAQMTQWYLVYGEQNWEFDMAYPGLMIALDTVTGEIVSNGDTGYDWYSYWSSNAYTLGPTTARAYCPWRTFYMFIKSANDVISSVDVENATEDQLICLGQAKAYRALNYLEMAQIYEFKAPTDPAVASSYAPEGNITGMTVPIVSDQTTQDEAKANPRASKEEIGTFILADLDDAEKYLEGYTPSSTLLPGIAVVYGLKARYYMAYGDYAKAASYATKAIEAKGGSPLTQTQWEDPTTGFNNASANSNSWMWHVAYSAESMGNLCVFVNHMSPECTWSSYAWAVARGINKSVYNQIPDTDWRKHSWIDPDGQKYYNYKTNRDVFGDAKKLPAYSSLKFRPGSGDCATYKVGGATDVPIMRLEEMYFIKAEALALAGDLAGGKAVLTEIMQTRNPEYDCSACATAKAFQNEVYFQKRVEFWGEGIIFFDAKRIGAGINNGYKGTNVQAGYRYNVTGVAPQWNWCIPQSEIEGNPVLQGYNNPEPAKSLTEWTE